MNGFGAPTGSPASRRATGPGIASPLFVSTLLALASASALGQDGGAVLLAGEHASSIVDLDRGRLDVFEPGQSPFLSIPLGIVLNPSWPPRVLAARGPDAILRMYDEDEPKEGRTPILENILAALTVPGRAERASVAVRAGRYGPILNYGIPGPTFADLGAAAGAGSPYGEALAYDRAVGGEPLLVAGAALPNGVSLRAPQRLVLRIDEVFGEEAPAAFRMQGAVGVDDASSADARLDFSVSVDGEVLFQKAKVARGDAPIAFDFAVPAGSELAIQVRKNGDAAAVIADLLDIRLDAGGGGGVPLSRLLASAEEGVDFLATDADEPGGVTGAWLAPGYEPAWSRPGSDVALPGAQDTRPRASTEPFQPGPLLFAFVGPEDRWLGLGLTLLPAAVRASWQDGRIRLGLPTAQLAAESPGGNVSIGVAVIVAASRAELLARFREVLVENGDVRVIRGEGSLDAPEWWRRPLLVVGPGSTGDSAGRFDDATVERGIATAETALAGPDAGAPPYDAFTVVIDGPWNALAGDPRPSEAFERLATIITTQHLRGRRVLLRFDPFVVEKDSLADSMGIAVHGALDGTFVSRCQSYLREVAQRALASDPGALNADGLLVGGLEAVRDPASGTTYRNLAAGVGWREEHRVLEMLRVEARRAKADALLLAPIASPEFLGCIDGVYLPRAGRSRAWLESRVGLLAALMPDVPVFLGPTRIEDASAAGAAAFLRGLAADAVLGSPALDAGDVGRLDAASASALGALLRARASVPLGIARRTESGEWTNGQNGGVGLQVLGAGIALLARPRTGEACLAFTAAGDVELPLDEPVLLGPVDPRGADPAAGSARVAAEGGGFVLRGGMPGVLYRLTTRIPPREE